MSEESFEVVIITSQKNSAEILKMLKEYGLKFELVEERGFAPVSPETAIQLMIGLASLLPIAGELLKKIWTKKGYINFETRHRLARKMLADLAPLVEIKAEDKQDYSYYVFKTTKGLHFWELDRGEIKHGSLGRSSK